MGCGQHIDARPRFGWDSHVVRSVPGSGSGPSLSVGRRGERGCTRFGWGRPSCGNSWFEHRMESAALSSSVSAPAAALRALAQVPAVSASAWKDLVTTISDAFHQQQRFNQVRARLHSTAPVCLRMHECMCMCMCVWACMCLHMYLKRRGREKIGGVVGPLTPR